MVFSGFREGCLWKFFILDHSAILICISIHKISIASQKILICFKMLNSGSSIKILLEILPILKQVITENLSQLPVVLIYGPSVFLCLSFFSNPCSLLNNYLICLSLFVFLPIFTLERPVFSLKKSRALSPLTTFWVNCYIPYLASHTPKQKWVFFYLVFKDFLYYRLLVFISLYCDSLKFFLNLMYVKQFDVL